MWVLLIGNPIEGFTITGTFGSHEDAEHYGEQYVDNNLEWWIVEVNPAQWAVNQRQEQPAPAEPQVNPVDIQNLEHYIRTGENNVK